MKRAFVVALLASLVGCATASAPTPASSPAPSAASEPSAVQGTYQAPESGPTATIHFKNTTQWELKVAYFATSKQCKGRRTTGIIPPTKEATHTVRAGDELTFEFHLTSVVTTFYCRTNLRFTPEDGAKYFFVTFEERMRCKFRLANMSSGTPEPVPLKVVEWTQGSNDEASFCKE
jgi:hypothetical protein